MRRGRRPQPHARDRRPRCGPKRPSARSIPRGRAEAPSSCSRLSTIRLFELNFRRVRANYAARAPMADRLHLPVPGSRRAYVVGAGSFGTAVAILLARAGLRTTLLARTAQQAEILAAERENATYLPGVELPRELRIEPVSAGLDRADLVFLAVPSRGLDVVIAELVLPARASVVSLAKGLVPPDGEAPT